MGRIKNIKLEKQVQNISGVLFYCDYVPPYAGNFIGSLNALSRGLKARYDTKIVYIFPQESKKRTWIDAVSQNADYVCFSDMSSAADAKLIGELITKYDISIIHAHFARSRFFILASIGMLRSKTVKIYVHMHNHCWDESNALKKAYKHLVFGREYFIGCGESVAESMVANGYDKNHVFCVPNAIDFSRLDDISPVHEIADNNSCKCFMYGADSHRKGVDIAISAISDLNKSGLEIELYICVSKNREKTEKYILDRFDNIPDWCHILPPTETIGSYYKNCDIFLSPSREEGLCYAIVEAYYCGLNVIASDIPGQSEVNLDNIKWIDKENADALRNAIIDVQDKRQDASANKFEAENKFGLNRWVDRIINVYTAGR